MITTATVAIINTITATTTIIITCTGQGFIASTSCLWFATNPLKSYLTKLLHYSNAATQLNVQHMQLQLIHTNSQFDILHHVHVVELRAFAFNLLSVPGNTRMNTKVQL
jgi:bifunctional ADP-heptose synthase (sugar kinase/adenylyltransferase)